MVQSGSTKAQWSVDSIGVNKISSIITTLEAQRASERARLKLLANEERVEETVYDECIVYLRRKCDDLF